jgi:hypothetical protein
MWLKLCEYQTAALGGPTNWVSEGDPRLLSAPEDGAYGLYYPYRCNQTTHSPPNHRGVRLARLMADSCRVLGGRRVAASPPPCMNHVKSSRTILPVHKTSPMKPATF